MVQDAVDPVKSEADPTLVRATTLETACVPQAWSIDDVIVSLATDARGLSAEEAAARLRRHGPNRLPEAKRRSPVLRFLAHFHNVLIYVLLGSAVITAALGHVADTAVILAVVIANAIIGFIQEGRAEKSMSAIRQMLSPRTAVLRDGRRVSIDSAEVVPGDVVLLEAGDKLSADMRLMEAAGRLKASKPARDLFGDGFVEHFAATREWEEREFRKAITNWELQRYFEII